LDTRLEHQADASCALGVAFIAGYATGLIDDFSLIESRWLREVEVIQPQPAAADLYRRLFPVYCEFDRALAQPFAHLAEVIRA
jgi:hypothetical protein